MGRNSSSSLLLGLGGGLVLVGGTLVAGYFVTVQNADASSTPVAQGARPTTDADLAAVRSATETFAQSGVTLDAGGTVLDATWAELGATVDESSVGAARMVDGALGGFVPVTLDVDKVRAALTEIKEKHDRAPVEARLDLEKREVHRGEPGYALDIYGATAVLESAARRGEASVKLPGAELSPDVIDPGIENISTVMAEYKTKYKLSEGRRNDNLKLLASRINGTVIQPGEVFSFNETSGARSEAEGYKMAHVISAGEMVDGIAGGSCQISTTLHGAAFYAGLDLVSSTPHSRPSAYARMGLDATVVYPTTDLVLRNNFEFPVAVHFKVARGWSHVEILGKEKPYDKVEFEKEMIKGIPFQTITREDHNIGVGHMVIDQKGGNGYRLKRKRKMYDANGKLIKEDEWKLGYRPVIEYVRMGTNPDPNLPPPKKRRGH